MFNILCQRIGTRIATHSNTILWSRIRFAPFLASDSLIFQIYLYCPFRCQRRRFVSWVCYLQFGHTTLVVGVALVTPNVSVWHYLESYIVAPSAHFSFIVTTK